MQASLFQIPELSIGSSQHPVSAKHLPSRRLQDGQEIWPEHARNDGWWITKLSQEDNESIEWCVESLECWQFCIDSLFNTMRKLWTWPRDYSLYLAWLLAGKVSRLVLAIISKETREVVERWQFDVALESASQTDNSNSEETKENQIPKWAILSSLLFPSIL